MRAIRFDDRKITLVRDAEVPRREGEALVKIICAGICNTDLEILRGYAGFTGTPGHEFVGRVVEPDDSPLAGRRVVGEINAGCGHCPECASGDARHCPDRTVLGIKGRDGAFADYLALPATNLFELPDSISDEAGVFVEPLAAAVHVLDEVSVDEGSRVLVIGDGKLGQLIGRVLVGTRCNLTVVGRHASKLRLLSGLGVRTELAENENDVAGLRTNANRFDLVVEASGSPSGLALALNATRPRGVVILKSTHHQRSSVDLSSLVVKEIRVIGSRCGRFETAIDLLRRRAIEVESLISDRFPLEAAGGAFELAAAPDALKVLFDAEQPLIAAR